MPKCAQTAIHSSGGVIHSTDPGRRTCLASRRSMLGRSSPDEAVRVLNASNVRFQRRTTVNLSMGHFLSHVQNQLAVGFIRLAQEMAKLGDITGFLARAAPSNVVR